VIAKLPTKPPQSLLVSLADKTHNAEAILFEYQALGDALSPRFTGGADGTRWHACARSAIIRGVCAVSSTQSGGRSNSSLKIFKRCCQYRANSFSTPASRFASPRAAIRSRTRTPCGGLQLSSTQAKRKLTPDNSTASEMRPGLGIGARIALAKLEKSR